ILQTFPIGNGTLLTPSPLLSPLSVPLLVPHPLLSPHLRLSRSLSLLHLRTLSLPVSLPLLRVPQPFLQASRLPGISRTFPRLPLVARSVCLACSFVDRTWWSAEGRV